MRCIEVPEGEESLGQNITQYANTQNEVSSQDFAFLDSEQHRLVRELGVLDFEYILRSAEVPQSVDPSRIIDVRDAAVALACASASVGHSVLAKREVSRLFSDTAVYKALFNPNTDPLRLSRAVEVMRIVDQALDQMETEVEGVAAGIAVHGRRTLAHCVLRRIGDSRLSDPEADLAGDYAAVPDELAQYVDKITAVFPDNAYPGNVFKNQSRVSSLLTEAGLLTSAAT